MEAFHEFFAKLKNWYKSGTLWAANFILLMGGTLKFLEWVNSDWMPMIYPMVSPTFAAWLSFVIWTLIWYFRFKTIQSLADK